MSVAAAVDWWQLRIKWDRVSAETCRCRFGCIKMGKAEPKGTRNVIRYGGNLSLRKFSIKPLLKIYYHFSEIVQTLDELRERKVEIMRIGISCHQPK